YGRYSTGFKFGPLEGAVTLVEDRQNDTFEVFRWSGSDNSVPDESVASANATTDIRTYELEIDFGTQRITAVARDDTEHSVDLDLPDHMFTDTFHIEIGAGVDHEVEYHEVKLVQQPE
ncbi:MAG: hypothetical protein ABEH80_03355, partial [Halobaculum sp.]